MRFKGRGDLRRLGYLYHSCLEPNKVHMDLDLSNSFPTFLWEKYHMVLDWALTGFLNSTFTIAEQLLNMSLRPL